MEARANDLIRVLETFEFGEEKCSLELIDLCRTCELINKFVECLNCHEFMHIKLNTQKVDGYD